MNQINKKLNKINKKLTRNNTISNFKKIQTKIKRMRKVNNIRNRNKMPAANVKTMNRDFRILYQDGNSVRVTGRDLVYQIPSDITSQYNSDIITVIPANPCYWLGTRIAALAQGYQNYRPLNMKFSYIPQCAVTQQGNVIAGTLWNQAPSNVNLQQSLRTSNGGQLSQCYKPFTSVVRMKTNLQYNLYKTAGQFDQESNPFIYIAMSVGCLNENKQNIVPGYFYVTWSFVLKNPIGNSNIFYNSGLSLYQSTASDYENSTNIFLNPNETELPRGAILQMEKDENGEVVATYNGSYYDLNGDDLVWQFSNSTIQQATNPQLEKHIYYYNNVYPPPHTMQVQAQIFLLEDNDLFPDSYLILAYDQPTITAMPRDTTYYVLDSINLLPEAVGTFLGYLHETDSTAHQSAFLAPKDIVELVHVDDIQKHIKMRKRKPKKQSKTQSIIGYITAYKDKQTHKKIKQSNSDKYYTNIATIFEN